MLTGGMPQAIATVVADQMGGPVSVPGALRSGWAAASARVKQKHNSVVVCVLRQSIPHVSQMRGNKTMP